MFDYILRRDDHNQHIGDIKSMRLIKNKTT